MYLIINNKIINYTLTRHYSSFITWRSRWHLISKKIEYIGLNHKESKKKKQGREAVHMVSSSESEDESEQTDSEKMSQTVINAQLNLKPPQSLSFEGNLAENWSKWKKKFEIYMQATESTKKSDAVKIAILLHTLGEEAQDKYDTFGLSEENAAVYAEVIKAFENYCVPRKNESVCRHKFFQRQQKAEESFEDFLTDLKKLSLDCSFGTLRDSLIKDRIISGIVNMSLKDHLLREESLDLEKCTKLCRAAELANQQIETLKSQDKVDTIHNTSRKESFPSSNGGRAKNFVRQASQPQMPQAKQQYQQQRRQSRFQQQQSMKSTCSRCGRIHQPRNCPAFNQVCRACGKLNRFSQVCKNKYNVHMIEYDEEVSNVNAETWLGYIGVNNLVCSKNIAEIKDEWFEKIEIIDTGKKLNVKLDSGAGANVMGMHDFARVGPLIQFEVANISLFTYTGEKIPVLGKVNLKCRVKNVESNIAFFIVKHEKTIPVFR